MFLVAVVTASLVTQLMDGNHLRRIERLEKVGELQRVRWSDVASGRSAIGFVGKRAIVKDPGDARVVRELMAGYLLIESDQEDGIELAARLGGVPDLYFQRQKDAFQIPPNDPKYPGQWFFANLNMEDAWKIESGKPEVTIAVIDNGCDQMHPDLVDKIDPGRDSIKMTNDPSYAPNVKGNFHGTGCAGLVAASTNNGIGVAGACPGCRLRCVKLLDDTGMGIVPISADMDAFQFVLDSGAAVASNSWGFTTATPVPQPLADAIAMVHEQGRNGLGTIVVFAAGNDNRALGADELESLPQVTTVGAVDNFNELAQFSNYGPLAVVAPTGTLTTDISGPDGDDPGDYVSSFGGTSSACPIVSGIFGLLISHAPKKSATELENLLKSTAKQSIFAQPDSTGHDDHYGFGLVQPAAALKMLQPKPSSGCSVGGNSPAPVSLLVICLVLARLRRRA